MKDLFRFVGFLVVVLVASCIFSSSVTSARRSLPLSGLPENTPIPSKAVSAQADSSGERTQASIPVGRRTADTIMAKVNGEPIRWGEVQAGLGNGMFGDLLQEAVHDRLERLIAIKIDQQYLKTQHVEVAAAEVEGVIADLQKNPPPAGGCPCCSFTSLDAYLVSKFFTLDDLRAEVRIELGMKRHVADLWEAEFPAGEKRQRLLEGERARIEQTYANLSHIFFNTVQQPGYAEDPEGVRRRAKKRALDASSRLQQGAIFAELARTYSDDSISKPKGGSLGCVLKGIFGTDVEKAIQALGPGAISQPVESPWGYHIIRCEPLTDQNILDVLKSEGTGRRLASLYNANIKSARVERFE